MSIPAGCRIGLQHLTEMLGPSTFVWYGRQFGVETFPKPCYGEALPLTFQRLSDFRNAKARVGGFGTARAFDKGTCDGSIRARIPQVPEEHDNEECKAGSEDRDSDRCDDRHFLGSERSTRTIRRWRPAPSVPSPLHSLPIQLADAAQLVESRP